MVSPPKEHAIIDEGDKQQGPQYTHTQAAIMSLIRKIELTGRSGFFFFSFIKKQEINDIGKTLFDV